MSANGHAPAPADRLANGSMGHVKHGIALIAGNPEISDPANLAFRARATLLAGQEAPHVWRAPIEAKLGNAATGGRLIVHEFRRVVHSPMGIL